MVPDLVPDLVPELSGINMHTAIHCVPIMLGRVALVYTLGY